MASLNWRNHWAPQGMGERTKNSRWDSGWGFQLTWIHHPAAGEISFWLLTHVPRPGQNLMYEKGFIRNAPKCTLKIQATATPFLGVYSRGLKTCSHHSLFTNVHSSIVRKTQKVETAQVSFDWEMEQRLVCPYNGIPFGHRRGEVLTHAAAWMNLEN